MFCVLKEWVAVIIVAAFLLAAWSFLQPKAMQGQGTKTVEDVLSVWQGAGFPASPLLGEGFELESVSIEQISNAKKDFIAMKAEVSSMQEFAEKQAVLGLVEINLVVAEQLLAAKKAQGELNELNKIGSDEDAFLCDGKALLKEYSGSVGLLLELAGKKNALVSGFSSEFPQEYEKTGLSQLVPEDTVLLGELKGRLDSDVRSLEVNCP